MRENQLSVILQYKTQSVTGSSELYRGIEEGQWTTNDTADPVDIRLTCFCTNVPPALQDEASRLRVSQLEERHLSVQIIGEKRSHENKPIIFLTGNMVRANV